MAKRPALLARLDARSLAAFRVALGLISLANVLSLLPRAEAYFADTGMLSRAHAGGGVGAWSLHALSGAASWQVLLLAVQAALALGLAAGVFTRACAAGVWLLQLSLIHRNPGVAYGVDQVLALFSFWCVFLPVSRVWSLDARRRPERPADAVAEAGYQLQFALIYVFAGIRKLSEPAWLTGDFMSWLFVHPHFGSAWAARVLAPRALSLGAIAIEILAPLALLGPGRLRLAGIALLLALQAGIGGLLGPLLFPTVMTAGLLPFVPGGAWGGAAATPAPPARGGPRDALAAGVCALAVAAALVSNLSATKGLAFPLPRPALAALRALGWRQQWAMFTSADQSAYPVDVSGEDARGRRINLLARDPESAPAAPLPLGALAFPAVRTLSAASAGLDDDPRADAYARYACRAWNAAHPGDPLRRVRLEYGLDFGTARTPPRTSGRTIDCP